MEVAGEAGDGAGAVEAVRRLRPDVALMDIRRLQAAVAAYDAGLVKPRRR
jgi:DNA-binding NarL/FixJ family response regulator